ncbi:MAG: hypothetical protein LBK75_10270 [Oscillospiraceae bacterium]|jgi:hypothetical protein|nr:hypothetical protein [Oscillospiraceae bacterium]
MRLRIAETNKRKDRRPVGQGGKTHGAAFGKCKQTEYEKLERLVFPTAGERAAFCFYSEFRRSDHLMSQLTNATKNTRIYNKFAYHLSDLDCRYCANFISDAAVKHSSAHGCGRSECEFRDLRDECDASGRIKRRKGEEAGWRE